jgi:predicted deacylase
MYRQRAGVAAIYLLLAVTRLAAEPPLADGNKVSVEPGQSWTLGPDNVTFDASFARGRLSGCERPESGEFSLLIRPENKPINHSPWFCFKVSSPRPTTIVARLRAEGGSIRYTPKMSIDGTRWISLPAECFELVSGSAGKEGVLRLKIGPEPLWIAAQELVSRDELETWSRTLERLPFVRRAPIGRSHLGRTIYKLEIGDGGQQPGHVIIIGRQHPPEVTGSLALMRFVEEIVGPSQLAQSFRKEFKVLLVPIVNPDGVDQGHWRHNMGGVDLNRDWGPFAQPETRAVRDEMLALREQGKIYLHLDFHSTFNDVFYTQPDSEADSFTPAWLAGLERRFPNYRVNRSPSGLPQQATSQNWAHKTFGIPAITYELGDNTDRALIQQTTAGAAQEMMKLLLAQKSKQ